MLHRFLRVFLALALVLSLCAPALADMDLSELNYDDYFTSRDLSGKWDPDAAVELDLNGDLTITEPGVYVLSGVISLICGEQKQKVRRGDAFYFHPTGVHYLMNSGRTEGKVLWVSTPPSF